MRVVGLTGGIACGKSATAVLVAQQHGIEVIDTDAIAHDVVQKGRWGWRRVVAAFGTSILQPDGEVDRAALGQLVFSDAAARCRLNAATHPPVAAEIARRLLLAWLRLRLVVVVDMPLLFEAGAARFTRHVVVVAVDPDTQLRRLMARDGSGEADARARVAAQLPLARKVAAADVVLDNSGAPEQLERQVAALAASLRRGALLPGLLTSPYGLAALAAAVVKVAPRLVHSLAAAAAVGRGG